MSSVINQVGKNDKTISNMAVVNSDLGLDVIQLLFEPSADFLRLDEKKRKQVLKKLWRRAP